jgi:hypothetical protein
VKDENYLFMLAGETGGEKEAYLNCIALSLIPPLLREAADTHGEAYHLQ